MSSRPCTWRVTDGREREGNFVTPPYLRETEVQAEGRDLSQAVPQLMAEPGWGWGVCEWGALGEGSACWGAEVSV